ncbi:MAG: ATP-binding cassette domain-containing protein [Acidobacteria bacterium]|nr:ATP-binding cassette domain-containing protein [Acidobacteriota bacterium]
MYHGVHPWERLKQWLRLESTEIWVAVVYTAATGLVSLALPVAVQAVVNTVAFGTLLQPLVVLTLMVFVALCFVTLLNACRYWVVELIQRRIFVRMAGEVSEKLVRVEPDALAAYHGPELVNRFLEVVTVQKAGAGLLLDGLTVVVQTVIGMILLGVYHPFLLAFDVLLVLSIVIVLFPLGAGAIPTSVKESKAKYALVAWLEEVARHQIAFKTKAGAELAWAKSNLLVGDYLKYRARHFRVLMRQIVGSYTLQALASATLLGVGGWLVISRQMTLGQLVAAEIVVALVVSGFTKFGKHLESFYDLMASVDKLGYLTDLPSERETGASLPVKVGGMAVSFRDAGIHAGDRGMILERINVQLEANARVALVGGIGTGKSALLDVLYGLREPRQGYVEIDGRDLREVKLGELRSQVALVREPEIFEGTVLENLQLGNVSMTLEQARQALEQVGLLDRVMKLPNGMQTQLSTGGLPLSPGRRVQLEIARALAHEPRLLILDECLDWLDDLEERDALLDFLFDPARGWTLIVASHSGELLARCSRVLEIKKNTVVEVQR